MQELRFVFSVNEVRAGRLLCNRVIFLRQWTSRKQSSDTEHCFPLTHPLRKITKPLSSPWKLLKIFSGTDAEKATLFQRLLSPHPHPSKIAVIVARMIGEDDRQVSQNGMPFCTGCTLSGHILNLQGSKAPLDPSYCSPKKETAKRPLEVSLFHFLTRLGMHLWHFNSLQQIFTQAFCLPCALCHRRFIIKTEKYLFSLRIQLGGRLLNTCRIDLRKNGCWHPVGGKILHGKNADCGFCMSANREWQFIII